MESRPDRHSEALAAWLLQQLPDSAAVLPLRPLPGDAGQRRYYELAAERRYLAVYSPPHSEPNRTFVAVTQLLAANQLPVPKIYAVDFSRGFMLLQHLGAEPLRAAYAERGSEALQRGLALLPALAAIDAAQLAWLPRYDEVRLQDEMALFADWFVSALLALPLSARERELLAALFGQLVESALAQPQGFVHRDFHCRNLMLASGGADAGIGLIDYQDALVGPLNYDLVSLLKDCYWQWPEATVDAAVADYYAAVIAVRQSAPTLAQFRQGFDWIGLQRHIKVLGIFARLALRDGKPQYLQALPLVIHYTLETARRYPALQPFAQWFEQRLMPSIQRQHWYPSAEERR